VSDRAALALSNPCERPHDSASFLTDRGYAGVSLGRRRMRNANKVTIVFVLATMVCAVPTHADLPDAMLRKGAQLVLKYCEESCMKVFGKELAKHFVLGEIIDGLKSIMSSSVH
jgi:hypothetical protein